MTDPKPAVALNDVAEAWTAVGHFDISGQFDTFGADDTPAGVVELDGSAAPEPPGFLGNRKGND